MHVAAEGPFTLNIEWLRPQAFRWRQQDDWFYGIVGGELIRVRQSGDGLEFEGAGSEEALAPKVARYFRLDEDVSVIQAALADRDSVLKRLQKEHRGLRILRQDPWECLVSFICSQRTRVEGTATLLDKLAREYGKRRTLGAVEVYAIPTAKKLSEAGESALKELGLGLNRSSTLWNVGNDVALGKLDLDALRRLSYQKARERLKAYPGIGEKIAGCVCLFALEKGNAFPIDRNVQAAPRGALRNRARG